MDSGLWWLLAALAAVGACGVAAAVSSRRARRRLERELADSRTELRSLEQRLDTLARRVTPAPTPPEYVITTAATREQERPRAPEPSEAPRRLPVPSGQDLDSAPPVSRGLTPGEFATAALGESLVTLVSLGHGLRRALSAESRNRIGFEMRREVRRARKQRKRDLKEAKRHLRANALHEDAA